MNGICFCLISSTFLCFSLGVGSWRWGYTGNRFCLSRAPRHIVHVDHGVDGEQKVGTGDEDNVEKAIEHQGKFLWMHYCSDYVNDGHGDDKNSAGCQYGSILNHWSCWRIHGGTRFRVKGDLSISQNI